MLLLLSITGSLYSSIMTHRALPRTHRSRTSSTNRTLQRTLIDSQSTTHWIHRHRAGSIVLCRHGRPSFSIGIIVTTAIIGMVILYTTWSGSGTFRSSGVNQRGGGKTQQPLVIISLIGVIVGILSMIFILH